MSRKKFEVIFSSILLLAMTSVVARANDTTYSPATKTIEMTQPFTTTYQLTITSPSTGYDGTFPVNTTVTIDPADYPTGSSITEARTLVSLDTDTLSFTALGQDQYVNITITVGASVTPGSYSYTIVSHKPTGPGYNAWGNGSATLNVTVDAPTGTDTTPPSVTITSPTDGESFTFCTEGTLITVAFDAQDAQSAITAASADVNGNPVSLTTLTGIGTGSVTGSGPYTVNSIGGFTVNAHATSSGGTGDASNSFNVNYNIMWLPPLSLGKTSKGGSTVPVKFTARDCNGSFVHNEGVTVVVFEVTGSGDVQQLSGLFGDGASSVRIDDDAGQYIINFQTAAGEHLYRVDVYFNDSNGNPFKQGSKTFTTR